MKRLLIPVLTALATLGAGPATGHNAGHSMLQLYEEGGWLLRAQLDLEDVADIVLLDRDGDGKVTWSEIRATEADVNAYVQQRIRIDAENTRCALVARNTETAIGDHGGDPQLSLLFSVDCGPHAGPAFIASTLFTDINAGHVSLLSIGPMEVDSVRTLTADAPRTAFAPAD